MTIFFSSVLWLIVALGILVTVHEFGHFWVARRYGVRVLRFSVGFGKPIWRRVGRDGVEYCVGWIPLGGYVKMLDDREQTVSEQERQHAFNRQPLGARAAIVAAGPLINLLLAVLLFWLMYVLGIQGMRPVVGPVSGVAAETVLQEGDRLERIGNRDTLTWQAASMALLQPALERRPVAVVAIDPDGREKRFELPLDRLPDRINEPRLLEEIGLTPGRPLMTARIEQVVPGSVAEAAGLRSGDRILGVDGRHVSEGGDWRSAIRDGAGRSISLLVEQDGQTRSLSVVPESEQADGPGLIGVQLAPGSQEEFDAMADTYWVTERFGPVRAVGQAIAESGRISLLTVDILGKMLTGRASVENLSGPIAIADFARTHAELGLQRFLHFLGVLSLSLFILNLLPIPVLDGGHLLYYLIEWLRGKPLSDEAQATGQMVGLGLMACLMVLVIFVDLQRLLS